MFFYLVVCLCRSLRLGSFPASTGLFDWEKDNDILTGNTEDGLVVRVRHEIPDEASLRYTMSTSWREVVKL